MLTLTIQPQYLFTQVMNYFVIGLTAIFSVLLLYLINQLIVFFATGKLIGGFRKKGFKIQPKEIPELNTHYYSFLNSIQVFFVLFFLFLPIAATLGDDPSSRGVFLLLWFGFIVGLGMIYIVRRRRHTWVRSGKENHETI